MEQIHLIEPTILTFLSPYVFPDRLLIHPNRGSLFLLINVVRKVLPLPKDTRAIWIALFPLRNPTTCETEYLGGIEISMCTWSALRCPSMI